ncbi:alpha/beta fold hydrolase [Brevibacillus sp. 179-C9.3 HS]|uniref:alpha/beta fold hydrolase n=1 Tax=unclassified Brevibacillus TaxID=2684853 RepID=UPI0039A2A6BF
MGKGSIYKSEEGKRKIAQHYEAYIDLLNFEVERNYVETSFGKTHVLVAGPVVGKPLIIFQGGNCINPMTLSWFSSLLEKYRVYAPDTLGHPGFSDETRMSGQDDSFARWTLELMDHFGIQRCAFVGPSFGGGIILRLASYMPQKIDCSILVSPAGMRLGSKVKMIKEILLPLLLFNATSKEKHVDYITGIMSDHHMKKVDQQIIADIFRHVKLEHDMPKLTEKKELMQYHAPTLVIAGKKDVFFPESRLREAVKELLSNQTFTAFDMGHFPDEEHLRLINVEMKQFLEAHYD